MIDSKHFLMLSELFENFKTQALALLQEAEEFGFLDDVTGCYNRKAYEIRIGQLPDACVGVLVVDVNGLKQVNDTQGHFAGDVVLKDLGMMLKAHFGGNDVFRVAGDEFIVIKVNIKPEVLDKMVGNFKFTINNTHKTSVAIGHCHGDAKDLLSLITAAEKLMYEDKAEFYRNNPTLKR